MKRLGKNEFFFIMQTIAEKEECFIESIKDSTPESRKMWTSDEWFLAVDSDRGLLYESDCPLSEFSPEKWRTLLVTGNGEEAQFCPCQDEVLALLTKEDFEGFGSCNICLTLARGGSWLGELLPIDDIDQDDFDDILVGTPDDYATEEEFLEFIRPIFPNRKIPLHLHWPYKKH